MTFQIQIRQCLVHERWEWRPDSGLQKAPPWQALVGDLMQLSPESMLEELWGRFCDDE